MVVAMVVAMAAVMAVVRVVAALLGVVDHRLLDEALATTLLEKMTAGTVTVTTIATAVGIAIALAAPTHGRLQLPFHEMMKTMTDTTKGSRS